MKTIIDNTSLDTDFQVVIVAILTLVVLILLTYFVGRVVSSRDSKLAKWIDEQLMANIPAYRDIKLKLDNSSTFLIEDHPPIFVNFGNAERPGFLMEKKEDLKKCVVFIPKDFNSFNGNIYIVGEDQVRLANSDKDEFVIAMDHLGKNLDIS